MSFLKSFLGALTLTVASSTVLAFPVNLDTVNGQ